MTIRLLCVAAAISFALLCGGCGQRDVGGRHTVSVSGRVEFAGQPLEQGTIQFESDDNEHRAFSAAIQGGRYQLKVEPGPKVVRIEAERDVPGKFETLPTPEGMDPHQIPIREMYIPEKYNSQSELRFTVDPDGNSDADFILNEDPS